MDPLDELLAEAGIPTEPEDGLATGGVITSQHAVIIGELSITCEFLRDVEPLRLDDLLVAHGLPTTDELMRLAFGDLPDD